MANERTRPIGHFWMVKYLRYFSASLKDFPEKFISNVFIGKPVNDEYLIYQCPLCLQHHFIVDKRGYYETTEFSEDHFPPESVGGEETVLVCKQCNNEAGLKYESSLKERLEYISFQKRVPNSVLATKNTITNIPGWRHGALSVSSDKELFFQLTARGKYKLKDLTDFERETNNNGKGWEIKMNFQSPPEHKVTKSLIKAAYLYCFYNWGYNFVYSEQGALMRKALADESIYPIKVGWMWLDFETPIAEGVSIPTGMCFIEEPKGLQCLVVNLPLSLRSNGYSCVVPILIPPPIPDAVTELQRIQSAIEAIPKQTLRFINVNNPLLSGVPYGFQRVWEELTSTDQDG